MTTQAGYHIYNQGRGQSSFGSRTSPPCRSHFQCPTIAMCSVDSKAVFYARLEATGLSAFKQKFIDAGWDTQATFAFATGFSTSGPDEASFTSTICPKILGAEDHVQKAALRRFLYECFMITTHDLASRTQLTRSRNL